MNEDGFEKWFNEIESFGLRSERFFAECGDQYFAWAVEWLKAAFQAGKEQGRTIDPTN